MYILDTFTNVTIQIKSMFAYISSVLIFVIHT